MVKIEAENSAKSANTHLSFDSMEQRKIQRIQRLQLFFIDMTAFSGALLPELSYGSALPN